MDVRPDPATPQIFKLRDQAEEQETSLKAQEEEVNSKKRELEVLVEEEAKLGADIKKSQREIENLMKGLSDVEDLLAEVDDKVEIVENLQIMGCNYLYIYCFLTYLLYLSIKRQETKSRTWNATSG